MEVPPIFSNQLAGLARQFSPRSAQPTQRPEGPRHGGKPQGRPDVQGRPGGFPRPGGEPGQRLEQLFKLLDQDGDGTITREEAETVFNRQPAAPTEAPVTDEAPVEEPVLDAPLPEEPIAEEPAVEEPVVGEPVAEEPATEPTNADIKADLLAQVTAVQASEEYAALSDEQRAQIDAQATAIEALDPEAADFQTQLATILGISA